MKEIEETVLKTLYDEDRKIYDKWNDYGFLNGIENPIKKIFLSKIYEKFTDFILNIGEENLKFGNLDFTTMYIPIIRRLYLDDITDNCDLVFEKFVEWYNLYGSEYTDTFKASIDFTEYFKEFRDNTPIKGDVKKYCIVDNDNGGIVKSEYKEEILLKNLEFEGCSEDVKKMVISELSDLIKMDNLNICYFAIYKINSNVYVVEDTEDDINTIKKHLDDGKTISIFSGKLNGDNIINYRYNINK